MIRTSRRLARGAWLPVALLVAVGCKQGPTPEVQARLDSLSQASAQRDRLMNEVAENTRLVSEISRELAKVNIPARQLKVSGESPLRASRDTLIQKIHYMSTRVRELEPRLKQSEQHIKDLTTISDSLRNELASTMQNLQGVIDNQKETIDALTLQVETLTAENVALKDTLENMTTVNNTVYYVVGTKEELEQKGIIQHLRAGCAAGSRREAHRARREDHGPREVLVELEVPDHRRRLILHRVGCAALDRKGPAR